MDYVQSGTTSTKIEETTVVSSIFVEVVPGTVLEKARLFLVVHSVCNVLYTTWFLYKRTVLYTVYCTYI